MSSQRPNARAAREMQQRAKSENGRASLADKTAMSDWMRTEEALRVTQSQIWRLSAQHLTIQETERRRIAAELHDGLGQTLSLLKLTIEEAVIAASSAATAGASDRVCRTLERLTPQVKAALAELRRISMNLRPVTLDDLGIVATLSWYFREFEAACPNLKLERDIRVTEKDVPELLKISIFRIVQEATGNALKHAKAGRIEVRLSNASGPLELFIGDNGRGFDPVAASGRRDFNHGLGLQSMKERAELSGGRYEFQSAPGKGTRIRVLWPSAQEFERDYEAMRDGTNRSATDSIATRPGMREEFSACLACIRSLQGK
jgi:signal transduction histidine kinase